MRVLILLKKIVISGFLAILIFACSNQDPTKKNASNMKLSGDGDEVKLMILDPGHFHAALVQKKMYSEVNPVVHVYSPEGPDVENYLTTINNYNSRNAAVR